MQAESPKPDDGRVFTLHRYFIWANRLRDHMLETLEQQGPMPDTNPSMSESEREATEAAARAWMLPVLFYGSYWHASLHVVVEGWRKLNLTDPAVDNLLDTSFLDHLRKNRNAIFHFQPTYLDDRVSRFIVDSRGRCVGQAHRLHDALSEYFFRWFEQRGGVTDPVPDLRPVVVGVSGVLGRG